MCRHGRIAGQGIHGLMPSCASYMSGAGCIIWRVTVWYASVYLAACAHGSFPSKAACQRVSTKHRALLHGGYPGVLIVMLV